MSPDWAWLLVPALVIPPALGHLYFFILLINVSSAFGMREPTMDRIRMVILGGLLISSGLLLLMHFRSPWWSWGWPLWSYAVLCVIAGLVIWPLNSQLIIKPPAYPRVLRARRSCLTSPAFTVLCA